MTRLRTRLGLRLQITHDEWPQVLALGFAFGLMVLGGVLGLAAANTVAAVWGGDRLASACLAAGLATLLLAPVHAWLATHLPPPALVACEGGAAALVIAGVATRPPSPATAAAWMAAAACACIYPALASRLAVRGLPRRLHPVVIALAAVGGVLAGLVVMASGPRLAPRDLGWAWAACLLGASALLSRRTPPSAPRRVPVALPGVPVALPLACAAVFAVTVGALLNAALDLDLLAVSRFPEQVTRSYAAVLAAVSAAVLAAQGRLVPRVVHRLGLAGTMLLTPALLLGPTVALVFEPRLAAACLFIDLFLACTFAVTCVDTLAQAVPRSHRDALWAALGTVVAPVAFVLAGVLLWLPIETPPLIPLLVVGWMLALRGLRRRYLDMLVDNLGSADGDTRLASLGALQHLTDRAVDRVLEQSLRSPEPEVAVFALELVREPGFTGLAGAASSRLDAPHPPVRAAAIRTLAACAPAEARRHVPAALRDDAEVVRRAALEAAERLVHGSPDLRAVLLEEGPLRLRDEADPATAAAWIRALARAGWDPSEVRAAIRARRVGGDPLGAAEALASLPCDPAPDDAALLLADPDPAVRRAAARALQAPFDADTTRRLLSLLLDDEVADAARDALVAGGVSVVPALRERLAAEPRVTGRRRLCEVLGRVGSPAAADALVQALGDASARVRAAAARALRGSPTDLGDVGRPLEATVGHIAATEAHVQALEAAGLPRAELLLDELRRQLDESRETLEILQSRGDRVIPAEVAPVTVDAALAALAAADDRWVSRCARWAAGEEDESMTVMEKILFLRQVDLFKGLSGRDLAVVAENVTEASYGRDVVIFEEGEVGDALYLVVEGAVAVVAGDRVVQILGPRECFGEMALLSGDARSATIRAVDATRALTMRRSDFRDLIGRSPHLAFPIFEILSRRLKHTTDLLKKEGA